MVGKPRGGGEGLSLSVITPVKNRVNMIGECLESAIHQSLGAFSSLEIIVVDGGSTDGTVEKVRSYECCRLYPESVNGIYEGMNAGIEAASGDVICILNSDDTLLPGAFECVSDAFSQNPDADVVAARAVVRNLEDPETPYIYLPTPTNEEFNSWPMLLWGGIAINARFFRRVVFENVGPFNTTLTLAADREHLIRQRLAGVRSHSMSEIIYQYTAHAGSETMDSGKRNALAMRDEHMSIARWLRPLLANDKEALRVLREWSAVEFGRRSIVNFKNGSWIEASSDLARAIGWDWRTSRYMVSWEVKNTLRPYIPERVLEVRRKLLDLLEGSPLSRK